MGREEQIIENRIRKIKELREQGINPYPSKFGFKNHSDEIYAKYKKLPKDKITKDKVSIAALTLIMTLNKNPKSYPETDDIKSFCGL